MATPQAEIVCAASAQLGQPPLLYYLYNAIWYPALPFALIASGGRDQTVRQERLGRAAFRSASDTKAKRVWIHASSVGEVEALRPVVLSLMREGVPFEFTVTTMTRAGREAALRRLPAVNHAQLAPLDFAPAMRAFAAALKPHLLLIAETELWPNLIAEAARARSRVAIVNARLSERSMTRYRLIRPLLAFGLTRVDRVFAQTALDAERFVALGAAPERVVVGGNTKLAVDPGEAAVRPALLEFARGRRILIAGSTAPGEEKIILDAFGELRRQFPTLTLVLAPRHLERIAEVAQLLSDISLTFVKASELRSGDRACDCLLLDTMGELRGLYACATVAFVGGSLFPGRGGQSLIEPATVSIPVLFGPHHESQREIAIELLKADAGRIVDDAHSLAAAAARWLSDEPGRQTAGGNARTIIERSASGVDSLAHFLTRLLEADARID